MIDIKLLREDFEALRDAVAKKKFTVEWDALLELDKTRRERIAQAESKKAEQNEGASHENGLINKQ